ELGRSSAVAIPVGATHGARFGSDGARILIVRPRSASDPVAGFFERVAELRGRELTWLAWRLAGELRASDAAAPLAAEGFALELLVANTREGPSRSLARPAAGDHARGSDRALVWPAAGVASRRGGAAAGTARRSGRARGACRGGRSPS